MANWSYKARTWNLYDPANPPASPRRKYTCLRSRKARRELGRTLAEALTALLDELGPDHPDRNEHILRYITGLDERHPEWAEVWDRGGR